MNASLDTITSTRISGRPTSNKHINNNDVCTSVRLTLKKKWIAIVFHHCTHQSFKNIIYKLKNSIR